MAEQRTYWHLGDLGRKPSEYEIVTSRLLYYPERGFEVNVPFSLWYERTFKSSALVVGDGERFRDPRETTYTKYAALQQAKETFVDQLLESAEKTGYDERLDAAWIELLDRVLSPLRYPIHALQMVAGYVGHLAPSGRLVVACAFQAADEIRRIQRLAYRTRQLQERYPELGRDARSAWEQEAAWQPLRRTVEELLVTYDWGEALTALNLCLKPAFDTLFMRHFAELARTSGDDLLAELFFSLDEDCRWQRDWTAAFVRVALSERPENEAVIESWLAKWDAATISALEALAPIFEGAPRPWSSPDVGERVQSALSEHRAAMGLRGSMA